MKKIIMKTVLAAVLVAAIFGATTVIDKQSADPGTGGRQTNSVIDPGTGGRL